MTNRDRLEMLQTLGCFNNINLDTYITKEALDDRFWNIKESISYINKICELQGLNNRDKLVSELLLCEGKFRNVFFSKTIYNILNIDLSKLKMGDVTLYFLKEYEHDISKRLNILNLSDKLSGEKIYSKLEYNIVEYGHRLLEYLWKCDGFNKAYDRFLLWYGDKLEDYELYRLSGKVLYKFNKEGLKDSNEYAEIMRLDTCWINLGYLNKVSGLDKYKDIYLANDLINIKDAKMVF